MADIPHKKNFWKKLRRLILWPVFIISRWSNKYQPLGIYNARLGPNGLPITEYVPLLNAPALSQKPVKLICFYLPQFHEIPENNTWWGHGFTEWTNVQPAQPQFIGHYQPHIPGELGYYNLLNKQTQRRQIEIAKLYGIEGFCFYFYWFGGKRLLETPTNNYLTDESLDLPFCLCWANESWSRRWDGLDQDILIEQNHSEEDDLSFIKYISKYMRDPRYIRINNKPLLLVYRPSLLPSAKATAARWRDWCSANGVGEIYLAYTQSFEKQDPREFGFDAAIEFPPNRIKATKIELGISYFQKPFDGKAYDWRKLLALSSRYKQPKYKLFRSVCPAWDNSARRKNTGTVFLNNTPEKYQKWLRNAVGDTAKRFSNPDERLVFINAWNEWAEGAHLEPDAHYGYAWLQATRNGLSGEKYIPDNNRKVILVTHDAYPHGAQMLAANLAKTLNQDLGFQVDLVCLGPGPLITEYKKWATVHTISVKNPWTTETQAIAQHLNQIGHRKALVNTTVSGSFLKTLVEHGIECVSLIHELRGVIDSYNLHTQVKEIAAYASKIVFPANEVVQPFIDIASISADKIVINPQGLYKRTPITNERTLDRFQLRQFLNIPNDAQIVLGAGYADHRKGIDLFVKAGLDVIARLPNTYWIWIGHWEKSMQKTIDELLSQHGTFRANFIFPGLQNNTDIFYSGADIFALTSREDPFPSVVLEALDANLPVVGFDGAGGFTTLLKSGCGKLVPKEDTAAFSLTVKNLLENQPEMLSLGKSGKELINESFSFRHYTYNLLDLLGIGPPRISVVVPNFNYAKYLDERIQSIINQDYPIYEIIFLDDCSNDNSLEIAEKLLKNSGIDYKIVPNDVNSGSVFLQWKKGIDLARGTHVWIAEADDTCEHNLLSENIKGFLTPGVVLSYCESRQINENGKILANNYLEYVSDIDNQRWHTPFVLNGDTAAQAFCIKNIIPNVSAVLFDKTKLKSVTHNNLDHIQSYCIAGDWLVYTLLLKEGLIAFTPVAANNHRRHQRSMTISSFNQTHFNEIIRMQDFVASQFLVSNVTSMTARKYSEKIAKQFGLSPLPNVTAHI